LPKRRGNLTLGTAGIDNNIGGDAGGTFTEVKDFFDGKNDQRQENQKKNGFEKGFLW